MDRRLRLHDRNVFEGVPTGNGKSIAPTGKHFMLGMLTVGHWKNGKMDHEWLYWDNQDFMKQIGLAK